MAPTVSLLNDNPVLHVWFADIFICHLTRFSNYPAIEIVHTSLNLFHVHGNSFVPMLIPLAFTWVLQVLCYCKQVIEFPRLLWKICLHQDEFISYILRVKTRSVSECTGNNWNSTGRAVHGSQMVQYFWFDDWSKRFHWYGTNAELALYLSGNPKSRADTQGFQCNVRRIVSI